MGYGRGVGVENRMGGTARLLICDLIFRAIFMVLSVHFLRVI